VLISVLEATLIYTICVSGRMTCTCQAFHALSISRERIPMLLLPDVTTGMG
jgi:hypothetical protein